jgi:hypothetical protein
MVAKRTPAQPRTRANAGSKPEPSPPRLRVKLKTVDDVALELARLYKDGKSGQRNMADVSKLAYCLNLLAGLLQPGQLDARLANLEKQHAPDE